MEDVVRDMAERAPRDHNEMRLGHRANSRLHYKAS